MRPARSEAPKPLAAELPGEVHMCGEQCACVTQPLAPHMYDPTGKQLKAFNREAYNKTRHIHRPTPD